MSIFKACDIRGIAGSEISEDVARKIGRALAAMVAARGGGPVCVAGDFRRSTPAARAGTHRGTGCVGHRGEIARAGAHASGLFFCRQAWIHQRGDCHRIA